MKYLQKQLIEYKGKAIWLASYPKSGNTWFRCFLSALFTGEIDLKKLKTDGIFSSRRPFDEIVNIDSRLLLDEEVLEINSDVYAEKVRHSAKLQFIKIHDAYTINKTSKPIIPTNETLCAVYLVRNPLDIVGSFAHHNATTVDRTINLMNNKNGYLAGPKEGLNVNIQFRQLLMDWSSHVESWTKQKNVKIVLIRYEDMLDSPIETFSRAVESMGIKASKTAIKKAIKLSSFKKLKSQEIDKGFREKNIKAESFFRSGKSNTYEDELNKEQINLIIKRHRKMMLRLGYL